MTFEDFWKENYEKDFGICEPYYGITSYAFEKGQENCNCVHTDNSKVIERLEKENAELKKLNEALTNENDEMIKGLECKTCQIHTKFVELNNRITELENENNDLKNKPKAGKDINVSTKWHDLRKNPTDVPKENVTVLLLTEVEPVTARYDNYYEAFFRLGDKLDYCVFIAPMSYIAWCEIPKFEE